MKKQVALLGLMALLVSSCAGTKYVSSDSSGEDGGIVTENTKTPTKKNKSDNQELNVDNQEEVTFVLDKITEDNSHLFMSEGSSALSDLIISTAVDHIGTRYRLGGTSSAGFDCSGLVYSSFREHNISLPRSSFEMSRYGQKIKDSEAQRGDLIFFSTGRSKRVNHVGIVTEVLEDEIKFVHASVQLGVIVSSTKEPYYKKSYVKVARIL